MSSFVNSSSVPDKLPLLTILETLYSTCNSHIPTVPALPTPTCDYHEILSYIAALLNNLLNNRNDFSLKSWQDSIVPYLTAVTTETIALEITAEILSALLSLTSSSEDYEDETDNDPATDLCNIEFNLAFGGKILLHQTKLHLKRGRRYGLVGRNGAGKTTLMTSISKGKLDGWPQELLSYYLDSGSNVDVSWEEQNVLKHLAENNSEAKAIDLLESLNFTTEMVNGKISELSGGWQMKLRLLKAVLLQPDILLLDEPTNHLDSMTVTWLEGYLKSLTNTTTIMVSHDTTFMENLCTDIVHYEKRDGWAYNKLVNYRGKMSYFVEKQPQAKHYFELATSELKFKFPEPGRLEGIKTSTQKFFEMKNVDFRYPGTDHNQLTDVNIKLTLSSRVAVIGANGAGKSTLIKMIVGETLPSNAEEKNTSFFLHHNLRIAYIAQHSFHHVEAHYEESPCAYIAWRFKESVDREKMESEGYRLSDEEKEKVQAWGLEGIWSRRMKAGRLEYEVKKRGVREKDNKYFTKEELLDMGFSRSVKQADEKIAAVDAGLDLRPVTTSEVQKHLNEFGLDLEFGTYGKIKGLSGGQKVKLVLAAAMWNCPHMIVMDEPTNYLDREALGALSAALNEFSGAVLMISHNKEFYSSVCGEEWFVEADAGGCGRVQIMGESSEREMKAVAVKKVFEKEESKEQEKEKAGGNSNADGDKYKDAAQDFWGKSLAKKNARNYEKCKKKGDVEGMRKWLEIPVGKIMPGFEMLGDGKTPIA